MDEKTKELNFDHPLDILIVEDNQVDLRITEAMLQDNKSAVASIAVARTLKESLDILSERKMDIMILDLNLPDSKGIETIRQIREKYDEVSLLVNTGAYEEELGIAALEYGAQDFLVKGRYNGYTLIKSLHYSLKRKTLENELKRTKEQLIQAEKMKVVGGLASGVAHEVRNPLATIVYGVTYLKQKVDMNEEDIRTVVESIDEAAERASLIIKDLLDFSNLGKLKEQRVSVNELFDRGIELLKHELEGAELNLVKDYDDDLPDICVDKGRVEQVCINIILNAAIAVEKKGVVTLKTYCETLDEKHLFWKFLSKERFQVGDRVIVMCARDDGPGIKEADFKNIFDPFFTTRRAKGGVGLGLSVCKNIMEMHQGAIFLMNNQDQGVSAYLVFST